VSASPTTISQLGREPRVELDRDHSRRPGREGNRERAASRPDLEEHVVAGWSDDLEEPLDRRGAKEVLAEAAGHRRA
jgi:hypothetical protein